EPSLRRGAGAGVPRQPRRLPGRGGARDDAARPGGSPDPLRGGRSGPPGVRAGGDLVGAAESVVTGAVRDVAGRRPVAVRVGRPQGGWLLLVPALVLVVGFCVLPYLNLLVMSFFTPSRARPYEAIVTLGNYATALGDPFQWEVLWRTLRLGFIATIVCF